MDLYGLNVVIANATVRYHLFWDKREATLLKRLFVLTHWTSEDMKFYGVLIWPEMDFFLF